MNARHRIASAAVAGTAVLLLQACATVQPPTPDAIVHEDRFGEFTIGGPFAPDPARMTEEGNGDYALREPLVIGDQTISAAVFRTEGGVLRSVVLRIGAVGEEASSALTEWTRRVCTSFGTYLGQPFIPSPLGTPEPGEEWDPVYTETSDCEGESSGVRLQVTHELNWASDFHNLGVEVVLSAP